MTSESKEHLSSLMDGELSRDTGLFMARRLSSDASLSETWRRYHLIRDCLRRSGTGSAFVDLSQRLRGQLDGEPFEPEAARDSRRWLRPLAGLAVAASVALVAVNLVGPERTLAPAGAPETLAQSTEGFSSPNTLPALPASQPVSYTPDDRENLQRLNSYLLRHNQMAGSTGRQGFVSFVPIITTQVPRDAADGAERRDDSVTAQAGAEDRAGTP